MVLTDNAIKLLKEKHYFKDNESSWEDLSKRVSIAIADAETNSIIKNKVQKDIYNALINLDFIFSTPCLLNADINNPGQLSSCFVADTKDNIEDICRTDAEFAKIFQRNGGVGTDLSVLRPAKSTVETSNGYAGGVITFMRKYDSTADEMTKFNPSRKGAIKINLKDFHPQIFDFIHCKDDLNTLNRMNISVSFSDEFMQAVKNNTDWNLEFPDYSWNKEIYNNEWNGNINLWKSKGYPTKIYRTLKARELLKDFAESSWKTGEPGSNYQSRMDIDNVNPHLSMEIFTNPCSEYTNIPYSSCNLGSINLFNCIKNGKFDFDKLKDLTSKAIRWLDNMITVNKLPLQKIDEITKNIRPVGLGIMGLADTMYVLNIKYNSPNGYELAENIIKTMKETAIETSIKLAEEKGEYPAWKRSKWEEKGIKIRNCNHLSIAPTGTISFLAGVSGGCEPTYALTFSRRTYDGNIYYITNPIFENKLKELAIYSDELMAKIEKNHGSCQGIKEIPKEIQEVFVTAHDLTPQEHVDMVSILQEHVDLSLSKTVNFSNNATVEDIYNIYLYAWEKGLKGLSVYRDGCRENQTLSVTRNDNKEKEIKKHLMFDSIEPIKKDELGETYGTNVKEKVACGNLYLNLCRDENGNLSEMFINTSKGGICQSNINAISRLISMSLRSGVKVEAICDQLMGIKCPACTILKSQGKDINSSCPDAIGQYILEKYKQGNIIITETSQRKKKSTKNEKMKCPNCGEQMRLESGCVTCTCGFSRCG
jgi:ribonucleoside-diphosphate reductase alpha chain